MQNRICYMTLFTVGIANSVKHLLLVRFRLLVLIELPKFHGTVSKR